MTMPDSEFDERTQLLMHDVEKILKAHTDSLTFRDASYVMMRALARCIALHGLRLTVKVQGVPNPGHTLLKLRTMPWEEAVRDASIELERENAAPRKDLGS